MMGEILQRQIISDNQKLYQIVFDLRGREDLPIFSNRYLLLHLLSIYTLITFFLSGLTSNAAQIWGRAKPNACTLRLAAT
jgi:hypothetical protein